MTPEQRQEVSTRRIEETVEKIEEASVESLLLKTSRQEHWASGRSHRKKGEFRDGFEVGRRRDRGNGDRSQARGSSHRECRRGFGATAVS